MWSGWAAYEDRNLAAHDARGRWLFPLGPERYEVGMRERGEPDLTSDDSLLA